MAKFAAVALLLIAASAVAQVGKDLEVKLRDAATAKEVTALRGALEIAGGEWDQARDAAYDVTISRGATKILDDETAMHESESAQLRDASTVAQAENEEANEKLRTLQDTIEAEKESQLQAQANLDVEVQAARDDLAAVNDELKKATVRMLEMDNRFVRVFEDLADVTAKLGECQQGASEKDLEALSIELAQQTSKRQSMKEFIGGVQQQQQELAAKQAVLDQIDSELDAAEKQNGELMTRKKQLDDQISQILAGGASPSAQRRARRRADTTQVTQSDATAAAVLLQTGGPFDAICEESNRGMFPDLEPQICDTIAPKIAGVEQAFERARTAAAKLTEVAKSIRTLQTEEDGKLRAAAKRTVKSEAARKQLEEESAALKQQLTEVQASVAALETELGAIAAAFEGVRTTLEQQKRDLVQEALDATQEVGATEKMFQASQAAVDRMVTEMENVQAKNEQCQALASSIEATRQTMRMVEMEINGLEDEHALMQEKAGGLAADLEQINRDIDEAGDEKEAMETQKNAIQRQIESLEANVASMGATPAPTAPTAA